MNKIIVWMQSSIDGYTAGPKGEFDWPQVGDELHAYFVSTLQEAGLFIYGRNVFDMMAAYWPIADTLSDSTPNQVAFTRIWRPMPKVVISRTRTSADWNATVLPDVDRVRDLAETANGDAYVFGGSQTVAALAKADLIDEYRAFVHPVLLGGGTPFYPRLPERRALKLVETRAFDGRVVALHHARD